MRDELKVIDCGSTSTPAKLKGKATIELRDANTGDLVYQKEEHNLVTNYFQGPFDLEICGRFTRRLHDYLSKVRGIELLNTSLPEDPNNATMQLTGSVVTGFGNNTVNSAQTNQKWMSINVLESGPLPNGQKWVWDANPNQCNGRIECLTMINRDPGTFYAIGTANYNTVLLENMDVMSGYNQTDSTYYYPMILGKVGNTTSNTKLTDFQTGTFTNPFHIDWDNDIIYDLELDPDNGRKIILKRYDFNRRKIYMKYPLKPILIDEKIIEIANPINWVGESTTNYTPFTVKLEGNTLYLVKSSMSKWEHYSTSLRIIKINIENGTYTDEVKSITSSIENIHKGYIDSSNISRNPIFIKDLYPILNGYIYLVDNYNTNRRIAKINLNDVSDVTFIDVPTTPYPYYTTYAYQGPSIVTDKYIIFMHAYGNNTYYRLTLSLEDHTTAYTYFQLSARHELDSTTLKWNGNSVNNFQRNFANNTFFDITNGVFTSVRISTNTYHNLIEQHFEAPALITINNVNPVTKTSDKTMRVIYELYNE
jgi:hypothetical protein